MVLLGALVASACGTSNASPNPQPKPNDPCSAQSLKLGSARRLVAWKPPEGCTANDGSSGRTILRTRAALDAQFVCGKGAKLGVDLAKHAVVQVSWNMSPAAVGLDAFDDAKQVTLVTRFRSPCPKDPRPMPITLQRWFLLPVGSSERTFAEANCTVDTKCP